LCYYIPCSCVKSIIALTLSGLESPISVLSYRHSVVVRLPPARGASRIGGATRCEGSLLEPQSYVSCCAVAAKCGNYEPGSLRKKGGGEEVVEAAEKCPLFRSTRRLRLSVLRMDPTLLSAEIHFLCYPEKQSNDTVFYNAAGGPAGGKDAPGDKLTLVHIVGKVSLSLLVSWILLCVPAVSFGEKTDEPSRYVPGPASYKDVQLLAHALSVVQTSVKSDAGRKSILYSALDGMAKAVDKYSYFVPSEMVGLFMREMSGARVGIGVHVARTVDGDIEVISADPEGPAYKTGVRPRDVLVAIDGKKTRDMSFVEGLKLLSNAGDAVGSRVGLSVNRKGTQNTVEFLVVRELLRTETVKWKALRGSFGYIRVTEFRKNTASDFRKAIQALKQSDSASNGLIVDLRNNPGGDLQGSVELSRSFLDSGMVASLENNFAPHSLEFRADKGAIYDRPVAVLVDEGSASASELFSGALQCNGRAILVGRKTYGKNSVQTFVPISSDAGFYMTVGRFSLPDGRSIDGRGLTPDVVVDKNIGEEELLGKAVQLLRQ
jgi:carboxyl-terminal processing protease